MLEYRTRHEYLNDSGRPHNGVSSSKNNRLLQANVVLTAVKTFGVV